MARILVPVLIAGLLAGWLGGFIALQWYTEPAAKSVSSPADRAVQRPSPTLNSDPAVDALRNRIHLLDERMKSLENDAVSLAPSRLSAKEPSAIIEEDIAALKRDVRDLMNRIRYIDKDVREASAEPLTPDDVRGLVSQMLQDSSRLDESRVRRIAERAVHDYVMSDVRTGQSRIPDAISDLKRDLDREIYRLNSRLDGLERKMDQ